MPALGSKLRGPRPRRALVDRARLRNPFGTGVGPRLVLLAAPPGFGKTTLLAQWLSEAADPEAVAQRVAWVALDEQDADVHQFLTSVVASVTQPGDGLGASAAALLANDRALPVEDVLVSLVDDLDQAGPTVLALDDYHRAASAPVHEALGFLLDNLPPQVTIAITTRADPPLPLARLRSRGELLEVRAADLRFTRDESDAFLRTVMDLDLAPAHVTALESRTEGWVAGLQLAALSARSRATSGADIAEFVDAFSGSHRFVVDYLVEEVLDTQPDDVRRFLLSTSVLEQLTGPLCDAVTGLPDGQTRLDQLDRGNVFLVALDDQRLWFRYHQLFADALRARLQAEHPEQVAVLHHAASRWYAGQGMLDDALHHAAEAGDTGWLAGLLEYALPELRQHRRDRTIIRWLDALPEAAVRPRPLLATTRAWSRLSQGDLVGASAWLDVAEHPPTVPPHVIPLPPTVIPANAGIPEPAPTALPEPLVAARADELRTTPASIAIYRAALAQAAGDAPATVRYAQDAEAAAQPSDHFVLGAAAGFLGLAAWAAGDLATAVDTFRRAVEQLGAAGNVTDQLGATVVLANMAIANGRPDEAQQLYERALQAAEDHPGAAAAIAADLHVGLADVLRERGDLQTAAEHLQTAKELGESASLPENRFRWPVVQAWILVARGDHDGALEQLDRAEALYRPGYFPDTRPIPAMRAHVHLLAGRLAEAQRWLSLTKPHPTDYLHEYDALTHARALIAEHHPDAALPLLTQTLESAERADRRGSVLEARMLRALASHSAGDDQSAHEDIALALAEGVPPGFCRRFLDEGEPMKRLLRSYAASAGTGGAAPLARQLLNQTNVPQPSVTLPEALSERELEVLRLLASDLSGPEIAAHLFVSINTLRSHTKHIFTKLDVRTRRAAVRRAEELDLRQGPRHPGPDPGSRL